MSDDHESRPGTGRPVSGERSSLVQGIGVHDRGDSFFFSVGGVAGPPPQGKKSLACMARKTRISGYTYLDHVAVH